MDRKIERERLLYWIVPQVLELTVTTEYTRHMSRIDSKEPCVEPDRTGWRRDRHDRGLCRIGRLTSSPY